MDIVVERVFADPQEENDKWKRSLSENRRCRRHHPQKLKPALLTKVLKSRRLVNDQVLGKIRFNSMSIRNKRLSLDGD